MNAQLHSYPPAPWQLNATAYISLWRIPAAQLDLVRPQRFRFLQFGGKFLVAAGFAFYEHGSDVQYDEIFFAVLARDRSRIGLTVPLIWVDSPVSQLAGREMWAIPKQIAQFSRSQDSAEAVSEDGALASLRFVPRWSLPWRQGMRIQIMQEAQEGLRTTPVAASTSVEFGQGAWQIPQDSPMRTLGRHRPFLTVRLTGARIRFGV